MKLITETWRKWLGETANPDFLDELEPMLAQWDNLQKSYGGKPPSNMPSYAKSSYYNEYIPHTGGRRATYSQAPEEEALEKGLIKLFLKHSDQKYLVSDNMIWAHNLNYRAHAQAGWANSGLDFIDFKRTEWTKAQNQRQRQVLSCHGFQKGSKSFYGTGQYGFFVQPTRVLYASKTDLASQTIRTAHKGVRARYTGGTLPKRPGLDRIKIKNPGSIMKNFSNWRKWYRGAVQQLPKEIGSEIHAEYMQLASELRKEGDGRNASHPRMMAFTDKLIKAVENFGGQVERPDVITPSQAKVLRDSTLLDARDISANKGRVEEALLANWTVKAWYFADNAMNQGRVFPENFWRKILPDISVPIYTIDQYAEGADMLKEISKEEIMRRLG